MIVHPLRGLLILEVKDWKIGTIQTASRDSFNILVHDALKTVASPLLQARHYALEVVNELGKDPQLIQDEGGHVGKLAFPWGYGVVLSNITRKQFTDAELHHAIEPHLVICKDEMTENVDAEAFQQQLWGMFRYTFGRGMTLPQIDRVRWHMFPEIRMPTAEQTSLFDEETDLPDVIKVMDLQQEQLARSLGDGHRVIHGVAGSGKTMILGYRAEYLAKAATSPASKPILVLCYNKPLSTKLQAHFAAKGLQDKIHVRNFHKWCRDQLVAFGQDLPAKGGGTSFFEALVDNVIRGVDKKHIPSGQYLAILIDEGHDFKPEWFKLVTQMVDPKTNSLLVLYDDAQSIFERNKSRQFSFKSVGIQAQGRTTILRINYRNTKQILQLANLVAADVLTPEDKDEDGIPLLKPVSCGREGEQPIVVRLPNLKAEADKLAELLQTSHQEGHAWADMAVLCNDYRHMSECAHAMKRKGLPYQVRKKSGDYKPELDSITIMTMRVSKGLEFPIVALHGVGHMTLDGKDVENETRVFYVAATRATHKLILGMSADGAFAERLITMST